jgi:hypothetical protein
MMPRLLKMTTLLLGIATAATLLCAEARVLAADRHKKADDAAVRPGITGSQPPAFSIPVEPLGFYPPGAYYRGQRESLVSLDFLDENRLLFTFRAPGLIRRTQFGADVRQIRALVLSLPDGSVEAEARWMLHDTERYLWMQRDGHFILRDGDTLKEGNASLALTPLLHFPGPVQWLQMDPTQQYLVTDSLEPSGAKPKSGEVDSPVTAQASVTLGNDDSQGESNTVLRIMRRESGKVMLVSRVRGVVQLPISPDGYLEALPSSGRAWTLNLNYFTGDGKVLSKLESACQPPLTFLSRTVALANTCSPQGGRRLVAVSTDGRRLWDAPSVPTQVWPLLITSPDGSRFARETLIVAHPVDVFAPLDFDDVNGQLVEVYDAAEGRRELMVPANPVLDGGGNVAFSPSGQRVAVLNAGAIQVYDLSKPAPASPENGHQAP